MTLCNFLPFVRPNVIWDGPATDCRYINECWESGSGGVDSPTHWFSEVDPAGELGLLAGQVLHVNINASFWYVPLAQASHVDCTALNL